ncbi:MAG TPA: YwaF family protein [Candidatus Borkfalkia excrementipullorum]|nr:YwaF family protein [Candidatus Borkfalkia excrementipullorum]
MLYDTNHIIYIAVSLILPVLILLLLSRVQAPKAKNIILKVIGTATYLLHISIMWTDFLSNGSANAADNILFPIYFCNFTMLLLMIVGFIKNRESVTFRVLAVLTAYGGIVGGLVTLFYPEFYMWEPDFTSWYILKSFLSHSAMLLGSLYLFVGGFVKIRVDNTLYLAGGLLFTLVVGLAVNALFAVCGLPAPNAMYLQKSPIAELPFLNGYLIGFLMLILTFIFTAVWELFACPKGCRWYNNFMRPKTDSGS